MSEEKTIQVPGLALNYEDGKLQSVGIGGELYVRERAHEVVSYERGYADGFDNGEAAIIQRVYDIISDEWKLQIDMVHALKQMVKEFWEERES